MQKKVIVFTSFLIVTTSAKATEISDQQLIHQQERQKALEAQLAPPPADIRLSIPEKTVPSEFPVDTPCFPITRVVLAGTENFPHWLPLMRLAQQGENQCLGTQGINVLMTRIQNRLINHGYVTSRVLAPNQNLNSKTLKLVIIPGKIRHIRYTAESGSYIQRVTTFPPEKESCLIYEISSRD